MLQIIGWRNCRQTQKAMRNCRESRVDFQFVDLGKRELSAGEWEHIFTAVDAEDLLDKDSSYYKKNGYEYRTYDVREELIEHPQLMKTPILRSKGRVAVGFDRATLGTWGIV
ncbi:MAG: hypothetical protein LKE40_00515 [Spirochaetia bacterium]|jgi:arsenate reductase-like glutaredoxin family protein|nr:hypothetical protein [Spirochaetia bacterium]